MSKLYKSILAVGLSSLLISTSAYADSLTQKKNAVIHMQSQVQANKRAISNTSATASHLNRQILSYNTSLSSVQQEIDLNSQKINSAQTQLTKLKKQMASDQTNIDNYKKSIAASLKTSYENDPINLISFLLDAQSFNELINRAEYVVMLDSSFNHSIKKLSASQKDVNLSIKKENELVNSLNKEQASIDQMKRTYSDLISKKKAALQEVNSTLNKQQQTQYKLESQIKLTQSQIKQIEYQTRQAEIKMQNKKYIASAKKHLVSASNSSIVSFAEHFEGLPYVWGGTTPNPGFDCSGFTQYVFRHFGISIPRTAEGQFGTGIPVSRNDLRAGDLVFFSTYAPGASHVGIYAGNGLMVDSQDDGLTIDSLDNTYWASRYIGARRYTK